MSEGRCGSGENALRQRMESRSAQGSLGFARGLLDLFGSLRLPHGVQDDKAVFFAEARGRMQEWC